MKAYWNNGNMSSESAAAEAFLKKLKKLDSNKVTLNPNPNLTLTLNPNPKQVGTFYAMLELIDR